MHALINSLSQNTISDIGLIMQLERETEDTVSCSQPVTAFIEKQEANTKYSAKAFCNHFTLIVPTKSWSKTNACEVYNCI